jgi:drug/metabolite transporter (DMT)-like permease
LFLRQKPTRLQLVAAPLAVAGLMLIVGVDWSGLAPAYRTGVVFGLLTAVSYAGYLLTMRLARVHALYSVPLREVAVVSIFVAALLGLAALAEGESLRITSLPDAGWLLAYGLLAHATGLMLIASSLARVSTTETGIALLLQPALSLVWDVLLFARPVTPAEALGACITLIAIFLGAVRSMQPASVRR